MAVHTKANDSALLMTVLSSILPTARDTLLLRACLHSGEEAQSAWEAWKREVGNPKKAFEADNKGLKGLLPLVAFAVQQNALAVESVFGTYVQVARMREEMRDEIYRGILTEVLVALRTAGISVVMLKGVALAETVYDEPRIRHNHGMDLLLSEQHIQSATAIARGLGFLPSPGHCHRLHQATFRHKSGLPLSLRSRPFDFPYYKTPIAELWERSVGYVFAGVKASALSPADNLLHVLAEASCSRNRSNLRWVCDAWYIIKRHRDLDWSTLTKTARESHLALPLSVMLEYLEKRLGVSIPSDLSKTLGRVPRRPDAGTYEVVLISAGGQIRSAFRAIWIRGSLRAKVQLLKFGLLPSLRYISWRHRTLHPCVLPLAYLYGPLRHLLLLSRRLFRASAQSSQATLLQGNR